MDADEDFDNGRALDLFDPSVLGVSEGELALAFLVGEENLDESSAIDQKLADAASDYLSEHRDGPRQKGTPKGLGVNRFTADDFESGTQRTAFMLVETMKNDLFGHKSTLESRQKAAEFLLCDELVDDTFYLCCDALGARCEVVRLRFHYEFWLRWATYEEPFTFPVCPVPEIVRSQVMICGGFEGIYIAQEAWSQPGISTDLLLARASGGNLNEANAKRFLQVLELLDDRFLMSQQAGLWYFTGRNPTNARMEFQRNEGYEVQKGGSIYWSALFPKM